LALTARCCALPPQESAGYRCATLSLRARGIEAMISAGSVDVQAPPGLEEVNGFRGPSPLITSGSPAPGVIAPPKPEGLKDELVREVTAAVREHIEWKTAAAVDTLWQKGQRAMQHLQQQQLDRTAQLQSQLLACAEAHQQLQRENAMLRSGLEALMKHLTLVFGAPPHMPMPGGPPGVAPGVPPAAPPAMPTATPPTPAQPPPPQPITEAQASKPAAEVPTEVFHTPAGSPLRGAPSAADELGTGPSPTSALAALPKFPVAPSNCGSTGSGEAVTPTNAGQSQPAQAPTFSLTLRRADNVPLGLDVVGEPDTDWLVVEDIRLGGAVEAWNRQCHGDSREIRCGDRIIMINGAKDAESMQEECLKKHLLRMSVVRTPPAENAAASRTPTSAAVSAAAASGSGGLRAEASEFVPRLLTRASSC